MSKTMGVSPITDTIYYGTVKNDTWQGEREDVTDMAIKALEKQMPKKIYHFIDDNTFETSCCGIDVTNEDFKYCPECGQLLGGVEEIEDEEE